MGHSLIISPIHAKQEDRLIPHISHFNQDLEQPLRKIQRQPLAPPQQSPAKIMKKESSTKALIRNLDDLFNNRDESLSPIQETKHKKIFIKRSEINRLQRHARI